MTRTSLRKSKSFKLDASQELRQALLRHWGSDEATCIGHAWDGVIWGKVEAQQLSIPYDAAPGRGAQLRWDTLQDLRIFNESLEMRLWRSGDAFEAILVSESDGLHNEHAWEPAHEVYFRNQNYELIRAPQKRPADADFVKLQGLAGQLHFPPGPPPAKLSVRLYYQVDEESGLVRCVENRLRSLIQWKERS